MKQTAIKRLLRTSYVKNRLASLAVYFFSVIVRLHVCSVSLLLLPANLTFFWSNFWQIVVCVVFNYTQDFFFGGVNAYHRTIYVRMIRPLTIMSEIKLKHLKRLLFLASSLYIILACCLVNVSSFLIIQYTVQNMLITGICEAVNDFAR